MAYLTVYWETCAIGGDLWWSYRPRDHILQHEQEAAGGASPRQMLKHAQLQEGYDAARLRLAAAVQSVLGAACDSWSEGRKAFWGLSPAVVTAPTASRL